MAKAKHIWTSPWLAGAAIVALTLAVYLPVVNADFMWDDDWLLRDSDLIHAPDGLYRFWFTAEAPDYFPLTWSSLWVEWRLWGTHAAGYRATNILLHAAAAVLLWRVLVHLGIPGAWLAGLLFAAHPVNVESVAWISERKNTLAMVFFLLTALAYLRSDRGARGGWYAACLVFFALALLSKTAVVMLPVALLVVTWWRRGRLGLRDLALAAPMLAMSLACGVVTLLFEYALIGGQAVRPAGEGFGAKLAISGLAVWFYLYKAVVPLGLSLVYRRWQVDGGAVLSYVPLVLLAGCFAALWPVRRTRPGRAVLAALACFVVMLLPLLGFIDDPYWIYSLVADRHQYFALVAVVALAGAGGATLFAPGGANRRKVGVVAAVAVVVALASLTWRRAGVFADPVALWRGPAERNPDGWLPQHNLGVALMASDLPDKYDRARPHLARALALVQDRACVWESNAELLYETGRFREAAEHYREALRLNPESVDGHVGLSKALRKAGMPAERPTRQTPIRR